MPNIWHRADDFKARHSQFSTCKRIGPKCNVAPVLKILGVPRLPPGGSLGTGKQSRDDAKNLACRADFLNFKWSFSCSRDSLFTFTWKQVYVVDFID